MNDFNQKIVRQADVLGLSGVNARLANVPLWEIRYDKVLVSETFYAELSNEESEAFVLLLLLTRERLKRMFRDIGYGSLVATACVLALYLYLKAEPGLRDWDPRLVTSLALAVPGALIILGYVLRNVVASVEKSLDRSLGQQLLLVFPRSVLVGLMQKAMAVPKCTDGLRRHLLRNLPPE